MQIDPFACDVCFRQRKSDNHWWLVYDLDESFIIRRMLDEKPRSGEVTLCSFECVTKRFAKYVNRVCEFVGRTA